MTREKLANIDQVIHVWAQDDKGRGRCGNVSFEGRTLYSYATPIAKFVDNKHGYTACLLYSGRYSISTSSHQSAAASAARHHRTFTVCYLGDIAGRSGRAPLANGDWRKSNLENYAERYAQTVKTMARARTYVDQHKNRADELREEAIAFCEFFGIRFTPSAFPEINQDTLTKIKEREKKIALDQKKERDKREKKFRDDMREIINAFISGNHTRGLPWNWDQVATEDEKRAVREYATAQWRAMNMDNIRNIVPDTLLRVRRLIIETSQGAQFPIADAKRVWPIIKRAPHANSTQLHGSLEFKYEERPKLGDFHIDSIDSDGTVKAGCHVVAFSEVQLVAKQLGLA